MAKKKNVFGEDLEEPVAAEPPEPTGPKLADDEATAEASEEPKAPVDPDDPNEDEAGPAKAKAKGTTRKAKLEQPQKTEEQPAAASGLPSAPVAAQPSAASRQPTGPAAEPARAPGYLVLARKYRPTTFDDVVGQAHVTRTLKNALATGRVHHAYCFTGSRGLGKTSTARILAKALNCVGPDGARTEPNPEPCGQCKWCHEIAEGRETAAIEEIDGASNRGIDDARRLRETISQRSYARYRVIVIDEVHMLTKEAFNALLKTLEEPPPHVKFVFATTEVQKLPETILSRVQRFDFRRVSVEEIVAHLRRICDAEAIDIDDEALRAIARIAEGGMRDSLSKLDQASAFCEGRITSDALGPIFGVLSRERLAELLSCAAGGDVPGALTIASRAYEDGLDAGFLLRDLTDLVRDCLVLAAVGEDTDLVDLSADDRKALHATATSLGLDRLGVALDLLAEGQRKIKQFGHARVTLELTVIQLCYLDRLMPLDRMIQSVQTGVPVAAPSGGASAGAAPSGGAPPKNFSPVAALNEATGKKKAP